MAARRTVVLFKPPTLPLFTAILAMCFAVSGRSTPATAQRQAGVVELARVRAAVGGESRLRSVGSLRLRGTVAMGFDGVTGKLRPPHPVEVRFRFPDGYLRIDENDWGLQRAGFSGEMLLNSRIMTSGLTGAFNDGANELGNQQREMSRLSLGLVAETETLYRLRLQRPVKNGQTFDFVGPDGESTLLDIDPRSGLPQRVRYHAQVQFPRPMTPEERRQGVPRPEPLRDTEVIITFENRVNVDGILLPMRIHRTANGVTLEDCRIDEAFLNAFPRTGDLERR